MALALLCMTMFVVLTTASMRATRNEARRREAGVNLRGKWIRGRQEAKA
ncbi:hypothetical protein [Mycoplana rhizolycopersici]|jgi:hypothetical protein|uniref:Uncharacterized protein n=1 Tax=Mycoplana rhizolycopersici TaxID=2746702 RepID=A0ABX2QK71_9HYPH|nr:hypothetical protein [Rhizobium rhizolycopersici]NVP58193.1 hypothetical protein [Rhizobium rhizolycopersici]